MGSRQLLSVLISLSLTILLSILNLFQPSWASLYNYRLSLTSCTMCQDFFSNWTWECLAKEYCFNKVQSQCTEFKNGYSASAISLVFEISSILFSLILLEKIILLYSKRDYGMPVIFYILLVFSWIFHGLSTFSWFYFSKSSFSSDAIFRSTYGPFFSILLLIWETIHLIYVIYVLYKEDLEIDANNFMQNRKLFGINPKILNFLSVFFLLISFSLILGSVYSDYWIKGSELIGGLIKCENCSETENLSWQCLAGSECLENSQSGLCKTYSSFAKAGSNYLILSSLSLFFIFLSSQPLIADLISRNYGVQLINKVKFM